MKKNVLIILLAFGFGAIQGFGGGGLPFSKDLISIEDAKVLLAFGGIGGFIIGMPLMSKMNKEKFSPIAYFAAVVFFLSIGIPQIIMNLERGEFISISMSSAFFTSIGIGMLIGGGLGYFFGKESSIDTN